MKPMGSIVAVAALSAVFLSPVSFAVPYFDAGAAFAKGGNGGSGGNSERSDTRAKESSAGKNASRSASPTRKKSEQAVEETTLAKAEEPKNSHGLLASELKGLNAVHANPNALANASPNSQVGRIALYRDAALATIVAGEALALAERALETAQDNLDDANAALAAYDAAYTGRTLGEIDLDIAGLDPADPAYQTNLDALNAERDTALAYETGRTPLAADVDTAATGVTDAESALADATTAAEGAQATEDEALLTASNGRELSDEAIAYIRAQLGL